MVRLFGSGSLPTGKLVIPVKVTFSDSGNVTAPVTSTAAAAELLPPLDLPPPQADRAAAEPARAQTLRKLRREISFFMVFSPFSCFFFRVTDERTGS